jgi:hypothetical protein
MDSFSIYSFAATDTSTWYGKKNDIIHHEGPVNRMESPCDVCPLINSCAKLGNDCKAFRIWSGRGYYKANDLQRLIRKVR